MANRKSRSRWVIATYAAPRAFAPHTRRALEHLGYALTPATRLQSGDVPPAIDLHVADERRIVEVPPPEVDGETPVVLLTGARPLSVEDPRVIGRVHRPAPLTALFRIFQQTLERNPRLAPRIDTRLAARCVRRDRRWVGAVLSLSEGGCLFSANEELDRGMRLNLQFALPDAGIIDTRAECVYRAGPRVGLAFDSSSVKARATIGDYVTRCLTSL